MAEVKKTRKYRLKSLMNIRKAPSLEAEILGTMAADSVIDVIDIENRKWLKLKDGTYILGGEFAERV